MSIRHKMGTLPLREAKPEDLTWATELFETRMRFVKYNLEYAVQMHTTDSDIVDRLTTVFGGGTYLVPGTKTFRWRVSKDLMLNFLDKIQPELSLLGGQRLLALANLIEAAASSRQERGLRKEIGMFARELARQAAVTSGEAS